MGFTVLSQQLQQVSLDGTADWACRCGEGHRFALQITGTAPGGGTTALSYEPAQELHSESAQLVSNRQSSHQQQERTRCGHSEGLPLGSPPTVPVNSRICSGGPLFGQPSHSFSEQSYMRQARSLAHASGRAHVAFRCSPPFSSSSFKIVCPSTWQLSSASSPYTSFKARWAWGCST